MRDAELLLVGEAAGYRGARVSGVAFTSERQLTGSGPAEATATIVHRVLHEHARERGHADVECAAPAIAFDDAPIEAAPIEGQRRGAARERTAVQCLPDPLAGERIDEATGVACEQ